MKRKISILLILLMVVLLSGCGNSTNLKKVDLNKTEKRSFHSLNFEMPTAFKKSEQSSSELEFYDIEDLDYDYSSCSLDVGVSEIYDETIEETIDEELTFFQEYEINHTTINNHDWTFTEAKSTEENGQYYLKGLYVADYNNERYIFSYTSYVPEKHPCDKLISKVTNSFKFS